MIDRNFFIAIYKTMILKKEKPLMLFGLDIWQSSYRGIKLFLGVYIFATLFAAVLTPPVYAIAKWYNQHFHTETTQWLVDKGVDTFYDRIRYIPIILALPWILKKCSLLSLKNLGLTPSSDNFIKFLKYFAFGIILAAAMFFLQIAFSNVGLSESASFEKVARAALTGLLGALTVGFLEELVFRALVLRCFYTAWGAFAGILFSSLFFAYKHFKVPNSIWDNIDVYSSSWDIGFIVAYYDTVGVFMTFDPLLFATLTVFGMALAAMYLYTRSLGSPIGFHAGIVWMIFIFKAALYNHNDEATRRLLGSMKLSDGLLGLIVLFIIFLFFVFAIRRKQKLKCENL